MALVFEAQTGTPASGMISQASLHTTDAEPVAQLNQEGNAGISPRVSLDVSRLNLRGSDNSLVLHTTFGLLEKVATLSFPGPAFVREPEVLQHDLWRLYLTCRILRRSSRRRCNLAITCRRR